MDSIEKLLTLALKAETTPSLHDRQVAKMKGGKLNKELLRLNAESNERRSGVKISN